MKYNVVYNAWRDAYDITVEGVDPYCVGEKLAAHFPGQTTTTIDGRVLVYNNLTASIGMSAIEQAVAKALKECKQ